MTEEKENLRELILWAIKNEIIAYETYKNMAEKLDNPFLRVKLEFLAKEEEVHRRFLEGLFHDMFPSEVIELPDIPSLVPDLDGINESSTAKEIFKRAMEAELKAADFYRELVEKTSQEEVRKMLRYLASMEMGHYKLLEIELEYLEDIGDIKRW